MTSIKEVDIIRRIDLSMDEQKKYDVIKKLTDEGGNKNRAALNLGISRRQVDRLLKAYRDFGKQAFVHGNTGRKPIKTLPDELKREIVDLYTMKYYDVNFTHFTELLARHDGISVSVSSVTLVLEEAGIPLPKGNESKEGTLQTTTRTAKKAAKSQRELCRSSKTLSLWKTPIPDAPDVLTSGNWNKWMLLLMSGSQTIRQLSISLSMMLLDVSPARGSTARRL
jgi:transposase